MIYGLSAWEKTDRLQSHLFANGNIIVSQRQKFGTSKESFIFGIIFLIFAIGSFLIPYIEEVTLPTLATLQPGNIIQAVVALASTLLITKSKEGMALREEQGGIHPEDTLLVLDGNKKIFTKQKGTSEEILAQLQDVMLEIQIVRNNKQNEHRIVAKYPQGKETLVKTTTQKSADTLLQNIKSHLQLS